MFDFLLPFDLFMARAVGGLRSALGGVLTPIMKIITLSGNMGAVFILSAGIMLFFVKTRKAGFSSLVALCLGVLFTNVILKHAIARERPFADVSSEFYSLWKAAGSLSESGFSFPSGHTTAATAFGVSLFLHMNKKYSWLFLFIPLIMGFSRIYFVVHFASDVIGGFISGGSAAVIAWLIVRALYKTEKFRTICNYRLIK